MQPRSHHRQLLERLDQQKDAKGPCMMRFMALCYSFPSTAKHTSLYVHSALRQPQHFLLGDMINFSEEVVGL